MINLWFWNNIWWKIENKHFAYPFWVRDKTSNLLKKYSDNIATTLIWIDWTNFSTNIEIISDSEKKELLTNDYDLIFLEKWIDWAIITWLKDIDLEIVWTKKSIWICLWVWDCASIIWASNDWDTIFNLHWWYKWILWLDNDYNWMIYEFIKKLDEIDLSWDDISMYISPMAWADFELDKTYIKPLILKFLKNYKKLDLNKYYCDTVIKDWKQKWNIDLRTLIVDVLKYHWIKKVNYSHLDTTNQNNPWPSYRLYANWKQEKNNRLSSTIFKRVNY